MKVLITRKIPEPGPEILAKAGLDVKTNPLDRDMTTEEIIREGAGCSALVSMLSNSLDRKVLEALSPELRIVSNYAAGVNNVDLSAASELGIWVTNLPGVLARTTAELTIGLLLACSRRIVEGDLMVRQGRFDGWSPTLMLGLDLTGKTLGIVGMGEIGTQVAKIAKFGFSMKIIYNNRNRVAPETENLLEARRTELSELLESADFVSLHPPLNQETRHLIGQKELKSMKPHSILVNMARGPVIDEAALVDALENGVIAGAGLDVYEDEPRLYPGLSSLTNAVLLPHIGSATLETRSKMAAMAAGSVVEALSGRMPEKAVNKRKITQNTLN